MKKKSTVIKAVEEVKPEAPKPRSAEEINNEYANACLMIGDNLIKIHNLDQAIANLKTRVYQLSQEMKAAEADKAKEVK